MQNLEAISIYVIVMIINFLRGIISIRDKHKGSPGSVLLI